MRSPPGAPRYRFFGHILSPARRTLVRDGRELPLIPRYFDLLVLLVERRNEAVSRNEILDAVWSDVIVTDGALSQAVRILRRTLGDDPREPTFIRTVSRHGYRFVCDDVVEEPDEGPLEPARAAPAEPAGANAAFDQALEALLNDAGDDAEGADIRRRQAAEGLHQLGTAEALERLDLREGHATARAYLRETRWDVPGAGPVPLFGHPGWLTAARILFLLRLRRMAQLVERRWMAAAGGGAATGALAGFLGGLVLRFGPGSTAGDSVLAMLPVLGTAVGGVAAAGVGAGLAAAEAAFRTQRRVALAAAGALSGLVVGATAHLLARLVLEGLFGRDLSPPVGAVEGLVLGGAVGLGYGLATPTTEGGMATPHGLARVRVALLTGLACALAAGMLGWSGRFLGAMSLDFMAQSFPGSQVGLAPLARLLGEQEPGVVTRAAISTFEGLMFGTGLAAGLTRRPR
ncbi:MAG: transcriptional regulator [Acidobacteria bacterium]|nr:transcriptional regulator [Acidobacteriota bacterium]MYJ05404.1 transcriptional regulator [Acidobacteriota bacterium]